MPRLTRPFPAAAIALALLVWLPVGAWARKSAPAALSVPGEPSITAGRDVFERACAACHGAPGRFGARGWRRDVAPADVTRMALGRAGDHPEALTDLGDAWDATAYVWTLSMSGPEVRRGEELAFQASKAMKSDGLNVALFHWKQVEQLKDRAWVLNHDEGAVDGLMRALGGARYTDLAAPDRAALVDYIYASYFAWPPSW